MQITPLLHVGRGVTAIIGGGGKTTLMETLAGELSKKGKVIITTTTHICRPKQYETLLDADEAAVSAALERSGIVCVASQAESGKLCAPWLSMGTLAQLADFVLVEADGAKRLPLKAHASHEPVIPEEEIFSFLAHRKGLLDGVAVTGGEPTLYPNLTNLICRIREMGFLVKLDSNGTVPEILKLLLREKLLDYVAIDIKNAPARYAETCGADVIDQVKKSAALLKSSHAEYEFRTTVCHPLHSPEDIREIGRWICGARRYFLQPFVDSGNLLGSGISAMEKPELEALLSAVKPYIPAAELRGV